MELLRQNRRHGQQNQAAYPNFPAGIFSTCHHPRPKKDRQETRLKAKAGNAAAAPCAPQHQHQHQHHENLLRPSIPDPSCTVFPTMLISSHQNRPRTRPIWQLATRERISTSSKQLYTGLQIILTKPRPHSAPLLASCTLRYNDPLHEPRAYQAQHSLL